MCTYTYWGFGLSICSEIEFPELLPASCDKPDVYIRLGGVPQTVEGIRTNGKALQYEFNRHELLLTVTDVARYYVSHGNQIIITPKAGTGVSRSTRVYVLASAMAAILLQRSLLPLHASAVKSAQSLVLVTGHSGAGKSTTLAGLLKNGHQIFSDDVVVLEKQPDSQQVLATASYPMIKLWGNSLTALNHERFEDRSFPILPGMDKYGLFFHSSFDTASYPIHQIFCLKATEVKQIQCKQLRGIPAFQQLSEQIYRPVLLQDTALRQLSFQLLTALSQQCQVVEVLRPVNGNPDDLVQFIETLILQQHEESPYL